MALQVGLQNYECNWNLENACCYDLDNSELKKKYGENVTYLCCGSIFNNRKGIKQHFTTKIHKSYLQRMTDEYKRELPSDLSPTETIQKLSKEIRELKVEHAKLHDELTKKRKEVEDKAEQIQQLIQINQTLKNQKHKKKKKPVIVPEGILIGDLL